MYELKLKCKDLDETINYINELLDIGKDTMLARNVLTGEVTKDGRFTLSSKQRGASLSEYVGRIHVDESGVSLKGVIQARKKRLYLLFVLIVLNALLGFFMIFSGNGLFMLFGPLFIMLPWINVWLANRGHYLKASLKVIFNRQV